MIQNLLDRMKFPFRKNREFVSVLHDLLGFYPHDISIYRVAFSHKSYTNGRDTAPANHRERRGKDRHERRNRKDYNDRPQRPLNNERLEYLGDAVLESVVSDILFRHFETQREGFLTATRSKIVQREALNRLAAEMGLERLILAAQSTRMSQTNIGGNAFEALMGAIYLDRGYKYCHWFISNRVIGTYVDLEKVAQKEVNFKSKLLEWSQKNRINIQIKDSADAGERKGFSTVIRLEGITIGRGEGRSKKESQQEAAKDALTRMRQDRNTYEKIFEAKEKRTSMEAEEAFALPKIDEIEDSLAKTAGRRGRDLPVLEEKVEKTPKSQADAAYDTAYDDAADYEVIDTAPEQPQLSAADYEAIGIPAPPAENELEEAEVPIQKKTRARARGAKTVGDAVKGVSKGATTPEEKAAKVEEKRQDEDEKPRAKVERKPKSDATGKKRNAPKPAAEPKVEAAPPAELGGLLDALTAHATEAAAVEAETSVAKSEAAEVSEKPRRAKKPRQPRQGEQAAKENAEFVITQDIPLVTDGATLSESRSSEPEIATELPKLSIDDFVFGMEREEPQPLGEADEQLVTDETPTAKPKSRRRRPAHKRPGAEAKAETTDVQVEAASPAIDNAATEDGEQPKAAKPKPRRRRPQRKEPPVAE